MSVALMSSNNIVAVTSRFTNIALFVTELSHRLSTANCGRPVKFGLAYNAWYVGALKATYGVGLYRYLWPT